MSLRRTRSHKEGVSNIDYRSKNDVENIKIFNPWKAPKDFGTMGCRNYHNPQKIFRNIFSPTTKINTHKDIVNDYPDPRYFTTAKFYKTNHMNIKTKNFINSERVANLEETFKGKDAFTGDSMSIPETMKQRQLKKKNLLIKGESNINTIEEHKMILDKDLNKIPPIERINKKEDSKISLTQRNLTRDKDYQLLKLEQKKRTDTNLVDTNRIKIIKQEIRKRYKHYKKINKVFQQWAKTFPNKITIYDAYRMINTLFVPINYNETKELILSASDNGEECLNLREFSNLIFGENENLNDRPFTLNDMQLLNEERQTDFNKEIIDNHKKVNDLINYNSLKDFVKSRVIPLIKSLKELSKEKYNAFNEDKNENKKIPLNKCNFGKFKQAIKSLNPPEAYSSLPYLEKLFDEYKNPKDNLINIGDFYNDLYFSTTNDYLSQQKDEIHSIHKSELDKLSNNLSNFKQNNESQKELFLKKKIDLDNQIKNNKEKELKERIEDQKESKVINGTVPSTNWINHVYENNKEHYNILNRAEHALSAKPLIRAKLIHNTRFGANPTWRNTADILVGDNTAATYISEKDRFNINRDVGKEDKAKNEKIHLGRQNRIRTAIQKVEGNKYLAEYLRDEKDQCCRLEKGSLKYRYEERFNHLKNIIE